MQKWIDMIVHYCIYSFFIAADDDIDFFLVLLCRWFQRHQVSKILSTELTRLFYDKSFFSQN